MTYTFMPHRNLRYIVMEPKKIILVENMRNCDEARNNIVDRDFSTTIADIDLI